MTGISASHQGADWRRAVEPYVGPDARRASLQVATTLGPLALTFVAAAVVVRWYWPLSLVFIPLIAGLLVRTFILMHDCAHGSFYSSRRVNDLVGWVTGVLTFTPFSQWRRDHALHHASSGDLDRRGHGDVNTLTVREYAALSRLGRFGYRLGRHPLALLFGGPFFVFITQRLQRQRSSTGVRRDASVWGTNVALALLSVLGLWLVGWQTMLVGFWLPYYFARAFRTTGCSAATTRMRSFSIRP